MIPFRVRAVIQIQRIFAFIFAPCAYLLVSGWMIYGRGYRIEMLAEIRKEFRSIVQNDPSPLIICANHLTLIDSFIMLWALGSVSRYSFHPRLFAWNLPEKSNFYSNLGSRLLCYVGKCVPVLRGGSPESARNTKDKIKYLLQLGDSIMIFPEGTRSRSGRIDTENAAYAVGGILRSSPQAKVVCIYMRGKNQETFGHFPRHGEHFRFSIRPLKVTSTASGLRAQKEYSTQIIHELKKMENEYFSHEAVSG